jgi:uncharacterized membrane protein YkoI
MKLIIRTIAIAAFVANAGAVAVAAPPAAHGLKGSALAGQAPVRLAAARAHALKARPGVITDQELEKEKGGSGLRYSFDIKSNGKVYEVGIDAKTGALLENIAEGKNPD